MTDNKKEMREMFDVWCKENHLYDTCDFIKDESEKARCKDNSIAWLAYQEGIRQANSEYTVSAWANEDLTLCTTVKAIDGSIRNKQCGFGSDGVPLFSRKDK